MFQVTTLRFCEMKRPWTPHFEKVLLRWPWNCWPLFLRRTTNFIQGATVISPSDDFLGFQYCFIAERLCRGFLRVYLGGNTEFVAAYRNLEFNHPYFKDFDESKMSDAKNSCVFTKQGCQTHFQVLHCLITPQRDKRNDFPTRECYRYDRGSESSCKTSQAMICLIEWWNISRSSSFWTCKCVSFM